MVITLTVQPAAFAMLTLLSVMASAMFYKIDGSTAGGETVENLLVGGELIAHAVAVLLFGVTATTSILAYATGFVFLRFLQR